MTYMEKTMPTKPSNIYQFKITLKEIKPKIWRRIQVPGNYTFWDLHVAIQDAMGWEDCHLHQFEILNPKTGEREIIATEDDEDSYETISEEKAKISQYFLSAKNKANYEYDFGDGWEHEVVLEKILPPVDGSKYPQCIAGERACPPEDCGGIWGYAYLLEIIADTKHPEYQERMEWLGDDFNSEEFDPKSVKFDNPKKRLQMGF
jgi:hypothetical protein